jgi:SHS2 domain-containing protein
MAHFYFVRKYELIEHTADVGIRVRGKDLKELFENAAQAMFDIVAQKNPKSEIRNPKSENIIVKQKAENLEELFVSWLNELLSLSAVKEVIFEDFNIKKIDEKNIEASITGTPVENYKINTEIKAATYHELTIKKVDSGWQAEVIFDV